MDYVLLGLENIMSVETIIILALSVFLGIIFGMIPGLTATLGVTLLLPFTFILGPSNGIIAMIGIYIGGTSGGLISATLLGIPGTGASIVTTLDGYPMAKEGKAKEALTLGVFSSLIGGLIGGVLLIFFAPVLAELTLMIGPWEYFAIGLFGLTLVIGVSKKTLIKGLIAATLGVFISMFGMDPVSAVRRFTFGINEMMAGFTLLTTLLGFFAISRLFIDIGEMDRDSIKSQKLGKGYKMFPPFNIIRKSIVNLTRSSIIGTVIGVLPGAGASIASFLSYDRAQKSSKTPEKFGKGHYEGIVAAESSNNALNGGALMPLITLGIPGDVVTAVILGGLIIHGLQPGPLLFSNSPDIVGTIFVTVLVGSVFMFLIQNGLMRYLVKIMQVPKKFLFPLIALMAFIGTYAATNNHFELYILLLFGIIGYVLYENNFDLVPLILGYILGPIIESNWRLGLIASQGDITSFLTRPISGIIILLAILSIVYPAVKERISKRNLKQQ